VADEFVPGKRTFLERDGVEFELPEGHQVELIGDEYVSLSAGQAAGSGVYRLNRCEQDESRVLVHVGDEKGAVPAVANPLPHARGYPFPSS
jgi:hypothetical protein